MTCRPAAMDDRGEQGEPYKGAAPAEGLADDHAGRNPEDHQ